MNTCKRGPLNDVLTWDMYVTFPFILWDPLSKSTVQESRLYCPLCFDEGFPDNPLSRSREWCNGRLPRLNPRVLFDLDTITLLVSAVYKCQTGHEVVACHAGILQAVKMVMVFLRMKRK